MCNRRRLLYVEDDETLTRVTSKALASRGFDVRCCRNIAEAEACIAETTYSHAVLDLKLENESSLLLIPPLLQKNPDIRIILLTGYASIATAVQAIKLGACNYLTKPSTADQIVAAFNESPDSAATRPDNDIDGFSLKRLEWETIQQALLDNNGNISATARQLKLHRRTLQRKLDKRPVRE